MRTRRELGSTVVETAIVLGVVFTMLIGLAQFSLILTGDSLGSNAARSGARYGIVNYLCADAYTGSTTYDGTSCTIVPSANYTAIKSLVTQQLAGMSTGNPTVTVSCVDGTTTSLTPKSCNSNVTAGTDLLIVNVQWQHLGATPFVSTTAHTEVARMVIVGAPTITSTTTSTTSTTTVSTTTTAPTTTSTTSTTTPAACVVSAVTFNPNPANRTGNHLSSDVAVTITTNGSAACAGIVVNVPGGSQSVTATINGSTGSATLDGGSHTWSSGNLPVTVTTSGGTTLWSGTLTVN